MLFSNLVQVVAASSALLISSVHASNVIPLGKKNLAPITVDGVVQHDNLNLVVDYTRNKYHASMYAYQKNHDGQPFPGVKKIKGDEGHKAIQRRQQERLTPQSGASFWSGNITIGGQPFRIDFDTGSADLWVPSINCTTSGCVNKAKYDLRKSKTGRRESTSTTFNIAYADGSGVRGSTYDDTVSIAGISATNQAFSAADFVETTLDEDPVDGIMGMGYQSLSALGRPPYFQNLYAQAPEKVNYNQNFSFYLTEGATGSELFLGGANPNKYVDPISYYPVINQAYWQIAPLSVFANNQATAASGLSVIVDTGTTLVYAPNNTVAQIFASVPGASHYDDGYWQFPCDQVPTIGFRFSQNGPIYNFSSSSLNLGRTSYQSRMCLAAIVGQSFAGNAVLMGDAFLMNVYTTFNLANNTVGFAKIGPNANQDIPFTRSSVPVTTSTTLPPPPTTSTTVQTGTGVWTSTAASTSIVITTASVGRPCGATRGTRTVCATPTATCKSLAAGSSTCKVGNVMTTTTSPTPQTTGTGVWKSTGSATTIVITTASVDGRCGAAYGTRTVCATPDASCTSVAPGTSTCRKASSTPIGLVSGDPFGGIWLSAAPSTTIAVTTAVPSGRCGAAFGTRTVCVATETCSSSRCRSSEAR